MKRIFVSAVVAAALMSVTGASLSGMTEAEKWVNDEFQPSTLSKSDQMKEMEWFMNAAAPFKGMEINVLSEGIPTHTYESTVLSVFVHGAAGDRMSARAGTSGILASELAAEVPATIAALRAEAAPSACEGITNSLAVSFPEP